MNDRGPLLQNADQSSLKSDVLQFLWYVLASGCRLRSLILASSVSCALWCFRIEETSSVGLLSRSLSSLLERHVLLASLDFATSYRCQ